MAENDLMVILEQYTQKVVPYIDPCEIILFGSQARGTAHKDSDIDVAIIIDHFDGSAQEYFQALTGLYTLCRDIDLRIEPHLMESDTDHSGFLAQVRHTGKLLYARAA